MMVEINRECIVGLLLVGDIYSDSIEERLILRDKEYLGELREKGIKYRLEEHPKNTNWIQLYVSYNDSLRLIDENKNYKKSI